MTAEATRNRTARACCAEMPCPEGVSATEAEAERSRRKLCVAGVAICTRALRIAGLAAMVRASSPSFARQ